MDSNVLSGTDSHVQPLIRDSSVVPTFLLAHIPVGSPGQISVSLLEISQLVKYHNRVVLSSNFLLLKHWWLDKARLMPAMDLTEQN